MATPHYILDTDPSHPYPAIDSLTTYTPKYTSHLDRLHPGVGNHAPPLGDANGDFDPDNLPHGALAAYSNDTFSADRRMRYTGWETDPGMYGGAERYDFRLDAITATSRWGDDIFKAFFNVSRRTAIRVTLRELTAVYSHRMLQQVSLVHAKRSAFNITSPSVSVASRRITFVLSYLLKK